MIIELTLLGAMTISVLGHLYFHLYYYLKLYKYKPSLKDKEFKEGVSVIICSKNEESNLRKYLPMILNQNYSNYEVIVVNDQSEDNTNFLLKDLQKINKNLEIVNIDSHVREKKGKKFALTLGIKTAKHKYLLLTDADCEVLSKDWISNMAQEFIDKDIVLGYSNYLKSKGLLNKVIRYDTFFIAQQYLSFALKGNTYMGVGRNLGYKKSLFFDNKGFASHINLASGDDDLFIQAIAKNDNVSICISHQSHTISECTNKWSVWKNQKRRHLTTSPLYKNKIKFFLAISSIFQILFWLTLIILLAVSKGLYVYIVTLVFFRLLTSYIVYYKNMKLLKAMDVYIIHPFYEFVNLISQVIFVLLNMINKPNKW